MGDWYMQDKGNEMTINTYIAPLRKWWWLLLAATLVASLSSLVFSLRQPAVYMVRTTLMVGNSLSATNPNGGEFYLQQQLAGIYADIAGREPIRQATMETLGLSWLPTYNSRAIANSPLVEIVVSDTNPTRAMVVANELAKQLVDRSPATDSGDPQVHQFLTDQLTTVKKQISDTQDSLTQIQSQQAKLTSARQIADSQAQIQTLQSKLAQLQNTYAALLANTQGGATNALTVIEKGEMPTSPVSSNRMMTVFLAGVVGLVLAAAGAYGIEYFDDTVKTVDEVKRLLQFPVIGYIGEIPADKDPWRYVQDEPRSPVSHSFRVLRTNLELLNPVLPIRSVLVTSVNSSEGKSTVAANLGVVMAQNEQQVICVDADFHRPMLHTAIQDANEAGLSDIFNGTADIHSVERNWDNLSLKFIPTGKLPDNPTELLGSRKMDNVLSTLIGDADVVIVDGPPFFIADASVLCTKVDCVMIVVRLGYTRRGALQAMKEQLSILPLKRVVVVMNRLALKDSYYNKYYPSGYAKKK
jgi:capsular exopolysaccharide synthesis family protein